MAAHTPRNGDLAAPKHQGRFVERERHGEDDSRIGQFIRGSGRVEMSVGIERWQRHHWDGSTRSQRLWDAKVGRSVCTIAGRQTLYARDASRIEDVPDAIPEQVEAQHEGHNG